MTDMFSEAGTPYVNPTQQSDVPFERKSPRVEINQAARLIHKTLVDVFGSDAMPRHEYTVEPLFDSADLLALEDHTMSYPEGSATVVWSLLDQEMLQRTLVENLETLQETVWQTYYHDVLGFATIFLGHPNQHLRLLVQVNADQQHVFIIPFPN